MSDTKSTTLAEALAARRADPRAMTGALSIVGGVARITFGAVGRIPRAVIEVDGDDMNVSVDPRPAGTDFGPDTGDAAPSTPVGAGPRGLTTKVGTSAHRAATPEQVDAAAKSGSLAIAGASDAARAEADAQLVEAEDASNVKGTQNATVMAAANGETGPTDADAPNASEAERTAAPTQTAASARKAAAATSTAKK